MYIIYELPDYWVEGNHKIKYDSTADYIMDEDLNITI